jgi:hypothetical protein
MRTVVGWVALVLAAGGLALPAGCSRTGSKDSDFIPSSGSARKALESALKSWQSGKPPGPVEGATAPKVQAVDSHWQAGQKLVAFEIVKEEQTGEGPRWLTVRLDVGKGSQEVRYAVFGIDPLLVYREEDYQKLSGTGK